MATWLEMSRSPEYSPAILSRELRKVHYLVGIDEFDEALAGETIILGGYLNTNLIKAKSILAEHLNVDSLSAISADIGEVTSGTITGATIRTSADGNRIELADNKLTTYMDNVKRVQLDFDRVSFYDDRGNIGGGIGAFFNSSLNLSTLSIFNDQGDIRITPKIVNGKYVRVNINSAIPRNLDEPSIDIQTFNSSSERLDVFIKPTNFSINTYVGSMLHFTKDGLKVSSKIIPYTVTSPPVGLGSVGTDDYFWYSMYAVSFVNKSERAIKEDIKELDTKALYEEVKNIKPYSFKYIETTKAASQTPQKNKETKETEEQKERIGIIAEEAPEKILDESGTGIDLYAYITLLLGALQESMNKIEQLEEKTKELSKNGGLS